MSACMFWFFEGTVKEMREVQFLSLFLMWKFQNFQHEVNLFAGARKHRAAVFLNSTCFFVPPPRMSNAAFLVSLCW